MEVSARKKDTSDLEGLADTNIAPGITDVEKLQHKRKTDPNEKA